MALFSDPVALTDGTDTRTYSQLAPISNLSGKQTGGEWIEDAADASAKSKLIAKHDRRPANYQRDLLSKSIWLAPAADSEGVLRQVTINLTVNAHPLFTEDELQPEFNVLIDAAQEANFLKGLRTGKI
jgi:hypothetical protein